MSAHLSQPTSETWHSFRVLAINGSKDTLKYSPGEKYKTISLGAIFNMLPGDSAKEDALAIIPSSYIEHDARTHSLQEERGLFHLLTLDIDQGDVPLETVEDAIKIFAGDDTAMMIYSSSGASEGNRKWRGLVPLSRGVKFSTWNTLQRAFYMAVEERIGCEVDHSLSHAGQPVFMPNIPMDRRGESGEPLFYKTLIQDGPGLTPKMGAVATYTRLVVEADEKDAARLAQARIEAQERAAKRIAFAGQDTDMIAAFNAENTIEQLLFANGYEPGSKQTWRSPYQTSKTFATKNFGDYWVSLSDSDAAAGIGAKCSSGVFGDAFDIYCHFDHGNDVSKAIKAYAFESGRNAQVKPSQIRLSPVEDFGIVVDDDMQQDVFSGVFVWPDPPQGKSTKPPATLENFAYLSDILGVKYSLNVMSSEEVVVVPGMQVADGYESNSAVTYMISAAIRAGMNSANVGDYMSMLCAQNPFHPVQQWIESKAWDGVSRVGEWMQTIEADNVELKETVMRRWAIGAIAALYEPNGVSAHGVLTFLGDQGIGKTQWFKRLAPSEFAKDGMILRPDSPDSVRQVTSYWMIELGELDATFRKSDIAALKSFLTADKDVYRLPYARKNTIKPRQTVFFASVNDESFLSDQTGNRRYWTINCKSIKYKHEVDMQQFWAEMKIIYESSELWFLDDEELAKLNDHNKSFTAPDPVIESLQTMLKWDADESLREWKTATEVCKMIGISHPTRGDAGKVGGALVKMMQCPRKKAHGTIMFSVPATKEPKWL